MKISVVGAGALGTFYAAMLSASSQDVTLVCRERDVATLGEGVSVTGAFDVCARPQVSAEPVPSDLVIVAVKSLDVPTAAEGLQLNPGGIAVIIHNGLGADEEAAGQSWAQAGWQRGFPTAASPSSRQERSEPTATPRPCSARPTTGLATVWTFRWLRWKPQAFGRGLPTTSGRRSGISCTSTWPSAVSPLSPGCPTAMMLEVPGLKALAAAAVTEAAAVAAASGARPSADPVGQAYRVMRDNPDSRSSMLQDIAKGRQTEINAINGKICEIGRQHGVPTPANDAITALVKGIEKRNGH